MPNPFKAGLNIIKEAIAKPVATELESISKDAAENLTGIYQDPQKLADQEQKRQADIAYQRQFFTELERAQQELRQKQSQDAKKTEQQRQIAAEEEQKKKIVKFEDQEKQKIIAKSAQFEARKSGH